MNILLRMVSVAAMISMILLFGLVAYWLFCDGDVLVIDDNMAIATDKEVYRAGDKLVYTFSYCKNKDIPAVINRKLVDGFIINYISVYSDTLPGCGVFSDDSLRIPDFVGPGVYYVAGVITYELNPLRKVTYHWRTKDFTIID
jgi:hypothetical protein